MKTAYIEIGRRIIDGTDYGPEYGHDYLENLSNAIKVNTVCGPAYMQKTCKYFKEDLKGTINMNNNMNILNEAKLDF